MAVSCTLSYQTLAQLVGEGQHTDKPVFQVSSSILHGLTNWMEVFGKDNKRRADSLIKINRELEFLSI